ncbi:hypothetical protein L2E82_12988 [Cichorium intybus]|uniref:Uncharacterized protein n=1 Tax=Cichorium intybus TaxID=13427 RepID=A0ACB9GHK9_CICIN|nr:hypothetical protein L2E82_12988 [Cichorium intybus]
MAHRAVWGGIGCYYLKKDGNGGGGGFTPDSKAVVAVVAASAAMASGFSAVVTMSLDTIRTRRQVLDGEGSNEKPSVVRTIKNLVKEGGLRGFVVVIMALNDMRVWRK